MAKVEHEHFWFWGKRKLIKATMKRYTNERPLRILDVGCGTGGLLDDIQAMGECKGVDLSEKALAYCREKGLQVQKGSAEKLPFPDKYFNVVILSDVLEHVRDDRQALAEARRVLTPDGIVIITVPAHPHLFGGHDRALGHYRRYNRKTLTRLVGRSPKLTYTNILLYLPALLTKGRQSTRDGLLPKPLNALAKGWYGIESHMASRLTLPMGLSLLCVATKRR